ncbi:MAG: TlyA family rRNA (cytidine-2'-O)-methyltransferase, partial [Limosilactobacillus mucosae]|nr:TlyA family rRNA (cytidine-2'-O)-methyltransferase [Limosilactobacillus mucosae]
MPPHFWVSRPSVVALIKPQFEAGKEHVGKHGIVRDRKVHEEVLQHVLGFATADHFDVLGLDFSPIKGGQGNIEFLAHLQLVDREGRIAPEVDIDQTISAAYAELNKQD